MMRIAICTIFFLLLCRPALPWLDPAAPGVDVVVNTQDNQFSFYDGPRGQAEWLVNNGAKNIVKIKGFDDPAAFRWDLSAYAGKTIEQAELHLCLTKGSIVNALAASTINADWDEGMQWGRPAGKGDSCWRWRSYPDVEWSYVGSDFSTASFGNFGTLVCFGYKRSDTFKQYEKDGNSWVAMKLDPAVVHAMVLDNFGIVATDPRYGYENDNPRVYSSEHSTALRPRLLIKTSSQIDRTPPGDVSALEASAGDWNGEVVLSFAAPDDPDDGRAFGYTVRYAIHSDFSTATDVERWRIPRPSSCGKTNRLLIEKLAPGTACNFWVQAYDKAGNRGNPVAVAFTLPAKIPPPTLSKGYFLVPDPSGGNIPEIPGILRYWACSELAKVNPATGNRMEDGYTGVSGDGYKKANAVWDSAANTVALRAVRNQMIGFQIVVQRLADRLTGLKVAASDLNGPDDSTISAKDIEFFKLHYAGDRIHYPDPAIPLSSPFSPVLELPSPNNRNGTCQSIWCDIYAPRDAVPGKYRGTLAIGCDQLPTPVSVNLSIVLSSPVLPDHPSFFVDLNGYGNKWSSEASRYQVFQICHKHRMVPNTLPYGWSGTWKPDRAPVLSGAGPDRTIVSWTAFAESYGPFFDGSGFSSEHPGYPYRGPGENTPIANFYTAGCERWPVDIADTEYGYDAIPGGKGYRHWRNLAQSQDTADLHTFWLESPDVMTAFADGYATGTIDVWKQFARFAQESGWKTAFQFFLNNKRPFTDTRSLWTLEEQYVADDFRADAWFMGLCKRGWESANAPDARFQWRIDTSTRWQQNWGQLSGICNLRAQGVGNDWDYRHDRYRRYTESLSESRWWYGGGPKRTESLKKLPADFLTHWSHGLDGGLPYWNNFRNNWITATGPEGGDDADLSILLSGENVPGHGAFDGRIATVRMKAMRFSQQLCELLNLLSNSPGWNRNLVARAMSAGYGDHSGRGYDAYGGDEYAGMDILDFYRLAADVVASMEETNASGNIGTVFP